MMRHARAGRIFGATIVAGIAALSAAARAETPPGACHGEAAVCRTLWQGEAELASMLVSGDVRIVERLFAEDAVWSLANGERWSKRQAIAALRNAPRMTRSQLLRADVHQHGTVAIVVWNEQWHDPATNREAQSFGTDTWLRRQGRWQIIASQEARLPPVAVR
ncbi:hypothetical protein ASG37_13355 [Sphingomonas sp. Leaf407]|nr:hypothetical protein ASE97_12610 [Sphingomonas sp. Leaf42]KQT27197.1 hypothetical protein ASG37_13355 [Sphingomonas sp. Leaf407]